MSNTVPGLDPVKIQQSYSRFPTLKMMEHGDSLTNNQSWGVNFYHMWPARLATYLRSIAVPIRSYNYGISGNTTTQMLARQACMTQFDGVTGIAPDLAILWGGVNDSFNGIAGATTQANLTAMGTTLINAGCRRIAIVNTQFLNFSSAGDTLTTPYATYATLRPFQSAAQGAIAALMPAGGQCILIDTYTMDHNLIANVAGSGATLNPFGGNVVTLPDNGNVYTIVPNADTSPATGHGFSYHPVDFNQHFNALGQYIKYRQIRSSIEQQTTWFNDLKLAA